MGPGESFPWTSTNFCGFNFTLMPKREHLGLLTVCLDVSRRGGERGRASNCLKTSKMESDYLLQF